MGGLFWLVVIGVLAYQHNKLKGQVAALTRRVDILTERLSNSLKPDSVTTSSDALNLPKSKQSSPASAPAASKISAPSSFALLHDINDEGSGPAEAKKFIIPVWLTRLQDNWMVLLGGICVGLAGIFMVVWHSVRGDWAWLSSHSCNYNGASVPYCCA